MVAWLLGSPLLTVSRLNPFTFQINDKLPYPPFVPLLNITLSSPSKHHPNTLNLVRGIMEEANNESEWWVLEIRGRGMSSDPQKILSNKTETLKGWQWSGLLFSTLRYWWGKIREFLSIAKKREERGVLLLKDADLIFKHSPRRLWLVCFKERQK